MRNAFNDTCTWVTGGCMFGERNGDFKEKYEVPITCNDDIEAIWDWDMLLIPMHHQRLHFCITECSTVGMYITPNIWMLRPWDQSWRGAKRWLKKIWKWLRTKNMEGKQFTIPKNKNTQKLTKNYMWCFYMHDNWPACLKADQLIINKTAVTTVSILRIQHS